ncbi:unnamed protein product [Linum trigynum]|uniref:MORF/ORRM1/DAG-like MORF domain-containing protein n=1 Tax=Linum trigynum TaxID=586398 RepID=A0AAV2GNR6_9ROSI
MGRRVSRLTPSPPAATHLLRRHTLVYPLSHPQFRSGASSPTWCTAIRWHHTDRADVGTEGAEETAARSAGAGCSDNEQQQQLQYCLVVMGKRYPGYQQPTQTTFFRDSLEKMCDILHRIRGAKKKKTYLVDFYVCGDQAAFGCKIDTEMAKKLKGMPEVADVIQCNSEPASGRADHSHLTADSCFDNKRQVPNWIISMGQPSGEELTEQQSVDFSMKKLVPILDSLLNKYSLEILINEDEVAFGCEIHEETAKKLKGMPGVVEVIQSPRTHSATCFFELSEDDSCSDEEMADYEPLPQFPSSFSDVIGNQKKLNHWMIFKEKPRDRVLTTDREMMEYSLETLAPVLSYRVRREKGAKPKVKQELAIYGWDQVFVFGLDMEDELVDKLIGMPGVVGVVRKGDHECMKLTEVNVMPYPFPFKVKLYLKSEQTEGLFTLDRQRIANLGLPMQGIGGNGLLMQGIDL